MNAVKDRFFGIPMSLIIAVVINGVLFLGLPILTQIQRSREDKKLDASILLIQHRPPKPPDAQRDKQLEEKKPKKIEKEEAKRIQQVKPKIDLPKFSFSLDGSLASSMEISMVQRQEFNTAKFRTAFTLSEVDQPPRIIRRIDPVYPFAAKNKGIEGSVTLQFIVTKEGEVIEPSVVESDPPEIFDNSALKAIIRWRFKPAIKDGKSVDVIIVAPLSFKLQR